MISDGAADEDKWLAAGITGLQQNAFYMHRALDSNNLKDALKYSAQMLSELRTSRLSPHKYYDLYMRAFDELRKLEMFFKEEARRGCSIIDLYELVQHAGNILPRLYLLCTVGSVYIKSKEAPAKDVLKDLVEMCRGIQHPVRGLFLRSYLSQVSRDKLPDIGSEYEGDADTVMNSVEFVLQNFTEMNKLWVRMQHQGSVREREKREKERSELRDLVGKNLHVLSQIEGVDLDLYKDTVLPRILEQVVNCKDEIAQYYLMDCIIQVFPDEYHLQTLETLLSACPQLQPSVDIKTVLSELMERLSNYAASSTEALPEFLQVEAFAKLNNAIGKVLEAQMDMPIAAALTLYSALLKFTLNVHPDRLDYVDQVLSTPKDLNFVGYTYKNFEAVKGLRHSSDEMYVYSASNKRVSVQLLGKDKIEDKLSRFDELTGASLSYLGVSSCGFPAQISSILSNLKELDLSGNLLSEWKDVGIICEQLPALAALNLSNNLLARDPTGLAVLKNIRVLVLNNTGINWTQVEILKHSVPAIEELHLMGNKIEEIKLESSFTVQGFETLRLLNLEDNCITEWNEILKFSHIQSLEQLYLNKNKLKFIFYGDAPMSHDLKVHKQVEKFITPFKNLSCLLLGGNNIEDLASVNSLNSFPKLKDVRLSENPITDPGRGGIARFDQIARLAKVEILNGSEISRRERKDSEIRYVRLVLSKLLHESGKDIKQLHPRFEELRKFHGIEDERPSNGASGPQKMASGLLSITLKCIGASIGEKTPLMKKLPATTTVGKLKILCQSFFKLKSIRPKLFLEEENVPLPTLLDDEMATLMDLGMGNGSIVLIDEDS